MGGEQDGADVIDFSVNLNPYGPPEFVLDVIKGAIEAIKLYPNTECSDLRAKISQKFGCDEAYVDFVKHSFPAHDLSTQNMIILRSLTKSFAIPDVRVGYAISAEENVNAMTKIKVPWSVSVFAQEIAAAVISTEGNDFLAETIEKVERSKEKMENALGIHTDANFYTYDVGNAREAKRELLRAGIRVRDCSSFGLPSHIRFSVRTNEDNELLKTFLSAKRFP
jgi:histidinol-phosphate/aromatic aminotransferase/cobyric acid decarboxylase-like protein